MHLFAHHVKISPSLHHKTTPVGINKVPSHPPHQSTALLSFGHRLASALTYYSISFSVGHFGVNIFLAQFFSGLSEAPSLGLPLLLARCGRRPFTMLSLLVSGISSLLSLLVSSFCGKLVETLLRSYST